MYAQDMYLSLLGVVGHVVCIIGSSNPALRGIKGLVIDETKNMIKILNADRIISIAKQNVDLEIVQERNLYKVAGNQVVGRPGEKISKVKLVK